MSEKSAIVKTAMYLACPEEVANDIKKCIIELEEEIINLKAGYKMLLNKYNERAIEFFKISVELAQLKK